MGAFGPCNLCSREDYFATGGHEKVKGEVLESLGLGKEFHEKESPSPLLRGKGNRFLPHVSRGDWVADRRIQQGIRDRGPGRVPGHSVSWRWAGLPGGLGSSGIFSIPSSWAIGPGSSRLESCTFSTPFSSTGCSAASGISASSRPSSFPFRFSFLWAVFTLSFIRIFFRGKVRWKGREVKTSGRMVRDSCGSFIFPLRGRSLSIS